MAIELRQQLRMTQQLAMTPQLQQAIKMLQYSRLEMITHIRQELEENPTLEEVEDYTDSPELDLERVDGVMSKESDAEPSAEVLREWENYLGSFEDTTRVASTYERPDDLPAFENLVAKPTTLSDHLQWQMHMCPLSETEKMIGQIIIENIDEAGYLQASIEDLREFCRQTGVFDGLENKAEAMEEEAEAQPAAAGEEDAADEETKAQDAAIEHVLRLIQEFEPAGVGARNLSECLLIQLREHDSPTAEMIALQFLNELANGDLKGIAKKLKTPLDTVIEAVRLIESLEPRPGRNYFFENTQYITPDIYAFKVEGEWVIVLNEDDIPRLTISSYCRRMLDEQGGMNAEEKGYLTDRFKSAAWLIKSIQQRRRTIYRVAECIVRRQEEFLESGMEHLRPMVLRDVADELEIHESTVSRVTNNKYMHTPQGIFELKFFFNSSISVRGGESIASRSVRDRIRQIVDSEDASKPLSDLAIVKLLAKEDIHIARRTVTKYREMMNIPPSSKRRRRY